MRAGQRADDMDRKAAGQFNIGAVGAVCLARRPAIGFERDRTCKGFNADMTTWVLGRANSLIRHVLSKWRGQSARDRERIQQVLVHANLLTEPAGEFSANA